MTGFLRLRVTPAQDHGHERVEPAVDNEVRPAVMDRSYRITVPKEVREELDLEPGDYMGFRIEERRIVVAKARWHMGR